MKYRVLGISDAFIVAILAVGVLGCGDDDLTCGDGTVERNGECVPIGFDGAVDGGADAGAPDATPGDGGVELVCGQGTEEVDGACLAVGDGTTIAPGEVGSPCDSNDECESGVCVPDGTMPNGYCSILNCDEDTLCPPGSHCYDVPGDAPPICVAYCDPDVTCRPGEGYVCQPLSRTDVNICVPECDETSCEAGSWCDSSTGLCKLPPECDLTANDPCDTANSDRICYPDTTALSSTGGFCLLQCDPADPGEVCNLLVYEVCQPLEGDPDNAGICVPEVCEDNEDCPAGAVCQDAACQPPARCDENGDCEDTDTSCVGGAGGQCMTKCSEESTCTDIHSGLNCADTLSPSVCLPLGSFPGGPCDPDDTCDVVDLDDDATADMLCIDDLCLVDCATGGDALCADVDASLICAYGVFSSHVCLPAGSFPGGDCDSSNECDSLDLDGGGSADMLCIDDTCLIDCSVGGDALCGGIDASLVCAYGVFSSDVCLPAGSFPGGPCRSDLNDPCDSDLDGNPDVDMVCADGACVVDCSTGGDTLCGGVSAELTCFDKYGY